MNWLPCISFRRWPDMPISTYSSGLWGRIELIAVAAFRVCCSVRRSSSCAQLRRKHWPYGASTTTFAKNGTFEVCQSSRPEVNNDKGEETGGVGGKVRLALMCHRKLRFGLVLYQYQRLIECLVFRETKTRKGGLHS